MRLITMRQITMRLVTMRRATTRLITMRPATTRRVTVGQIATARRIAAVTTLAVVLATTLTLVLWHGGQPQAAALTPTATDSVSPIFGVNMSLFDSSDELATNAATQATLRSWGVPLIRLPLRTGMSDATLTGAMQAILAVGATPMVILHGPKSGTLADDQHLLALVSNVFGNRRVYLEYGNEADLAGVGVAAYVAGWNQVIPALKQAAPSAYQFVGPVNFQSDPAYAAAFAKAAQPAPDYLSWHEYVCNSGNPDSYCTSHIANWANHASAVESAVSAAVGHTIPFFISEWNLDPNDESRYANAGFMQSWTRAALTQLLELVPLGLAGAMVYTATNHGNFGLINNGQLTPQGTVFRDVLASTAPVPPSNSASNSPSGAPSGSKAPGANASPTKSTASGTTGRGSSGGGSSGAGSSGGSATDASTGSGSSGGSSKTAGGSSGGSAGKASTGGSTGGIYVSFEDGLDGWGEYWGYDTMTLSRTGSVHYNGSSALKIVSTGTAYVAAGTGTGLSGLRPGEQVTFHVYASGGAGTIRPFLMDPFSNVRWPQGESSLPRSAGWFTVTFTVPSGLTTVHAVGIQLHSAAAGNWIALDALGWPG
jgi:uncharacterized membrane protein YgcG